MMAEDLPSIRVLRIDPRASLPEYASEGAAGADLRAVVDSELKLGRGGGTALVPTGLALEIPSGFEAQVRPRSGLAAKFGVTVLNAPGTIDSDYRGEVRVLLVNHGPDDFVVRTGDRIAQLVVAPVVRSAFVEAPGLGATERGVGGFGSTGR